MTRSIQIGDRVVGEGAPALIVAEVGVNHDGDLGTALELVDAAAAAGVGAVKFQTFNAAELATPAAEVATYQRERSGAVESQRDLLEKLEMGEQGFIAIRDRCGELGVLFLSTPFDVTSAELLARLGVPAFKVGSGELTNLPFLEQLASFGLPMLVSTGMATLGEVGHAVEVVRRKGAPLVLLHCVSSYPAPPEEANLRAIDTLRSEFSVPVGYSDHCLGFDVTLAAVARDACLIERHFTLDRNRVGPDHAMSLEPQDLTELVVQIRQLEYSLGDGEKRAQPSEIEIRRVARRSLVAARPLQAGEVLTADALAIKRPGDGLPPSRLASLVGRRLARALEPDQQLTESDLEAVH